MNFEQSFWAVLSEIFMFSNALIWNEFMILLPIFSMSWKSPTVRVTKMYPFLKQIILAGVYFLQMVNVVKIFLKIVKLHLHCCTFCWSEILPVSLLDFYRFHARLKRIASCHSWKNCLTVRHRTGFNWL